MERIMTRCKMVSRIVFLASFAALLGSAHAQEVVHAITGVITRVDKTAKTLAIKTAEGSEEVFSYSDHTAVRDSREAAEGAKMGEVESYFAGKQGTHVVVRYTGKGVQKTANLVEDFGKDTLKSGRGTVTQVDRAARTIAVKTADGAEATYTLGADGVVDTEQGVVKASRYRAKEGEKVVVHYTEDASGRVVRFLKKL
jgi:hypothetical protein